MIVIFHFVRSVLCNVYTSPERASIYRYMLVLSIYRYMLVLSKQDVAMISISVAYAYSKCLHS